MMPTFKERGAAANKSRPQRLQPSPDPRIAGPTADTLAMRSNEVAALFSKAK